jgi:hypothetical protein
MSCTKCQTVLAAILAVPGHYVSQNRRVIVPLRLSVTVGSKWHAPPCRSYGCPWEVWRPPVHPRSRGCSDSLHRCTLQLDFIPRIMQPGRCTRTTQKRWPVGACMTTQRSGRPTTVAPSLSRRRTSAGMSSVSMSSTRSGCPGHSQKRWMLPIRARSSKPDPATVRNLYRGCGPWVLPAAPSG